MGYEEEFKRKKELREIDLKREGASKNVADFEIPEDEIRDMDLALTKLKAKERVTAGEYAGLIGPLKSLVYRVKDRDTIDFWIEEISAFRDKNIADTILNEVEKYKRAA